jgi:hypothetical protein
MTNTIILKHTHVFKFNTEQNNIAKITKQLKEYKESWKSEIYACSQVQYWTE